VLKTAKPPTGLTLLSGIALPVDIIIPITAIKDNWKLRGYNSGIIPALWVFPGPEDPIGRRIAGKNRPLPSPPRGESP
jgi:hypothetical protein